MSLIELAERVPDMREFADRLCKEEDQRRLDTLIGEAATYMIVLQDGFRAALRAQQEQTI